MHRWLRWEGEDGFNDILPFFVVFARFACKEGGFPYEFGVFACKFVGSACMFRPSAFEFAPFANKHGLAVYKPGRFACEFGGVVG
jgi:hypothetical protein